jgi:hypothetical protein
MVPRAMIERAVRPMLTPSAVTIPGLHRDSSMIGIICIAISSAASSLGGFRPPDPPLTSDAPLRSAASVGFGLPSRDSRGLGGSPEASRSFCFSIWPVKRARAMSAIPNVATSFRSTSYGGSPSCSMAWSFGSTSALQNLRIASRMERCVSDHSIMRRILRSPSRSAGLDLVGERPHSSFK